MVVVVGSAALDETAAVAATSVLDKVVAGVVMAFAAFAVAYN